jgi:cell division protein FtsB
MMPRTHSLFIIIAFLAMSFFAAMGVAEEAHSSKPESDRDRKELKTDTLQLKQKLSTFNEKIKNYSKEIETLTDPKTTQKTVADLQGEISEALSQTAENGKITILAKKILETTKGWEADMRAHGFSPEREAGLEEGYKTIINNTEKTIEDITAIRQQLTDSLKKLQGEQDYLDELARIDQAQKMVVVLQNLLRDMKITSDQLNVILNGTPGV